MLQQHSDNNWFVGTRQALLRIKKTHKQLQKLDTDPLAAGTPKCKMHKERRSFRHMIASFIVMTSVHEPALHSGPLLLNIREKESLNRKPQINYTQKEGTRISWAKISTYQRALNEKCRCLSSFNQRVLSLFMGFKNRSASTSEGREDCNLFKCPLHCLWSKE